MTPNCYGGSDHVMFPDIGIPISDCNQVGEAGTPARTKRESTRHTRQKNGKKITPDVMPGLFVYGGLTSTGPER